MGREPYTPCCNSHTITIQPETTEEKVHLSCLCFYSLDVNISAGVQTEHPAVKPSARLPQTEASKLWWLLPTHKLQFGAGPEQPET